LQKHCFENTECINAEIERKAKQAKKKSKSEWNKRKKKMKEGLKSRQDLLKDLQKIFNEFIRLRDQKKPCISCLAPAGTYTVNAGHYYPVGGYPNLRFNEDNCHNQCVHCNQHKHGNLIEYRKGLEERIGIEKLEELDQLKNETLKLTIPEIKELIQEYKQKVKQLKLEQT